MKACSTIDTYHAIINTLEMYDQVFYTRMGDGDVFYMDGGTDGYHTTHYPELRKELIECAGIVDPKFMLGVAINYGLESGMVEGLFAPHPSNNTLINIFERYCGGRVDFYNAITFHYLSIFRPELVREFLDAYIRPKTKLFIGGNDRGPMEQLYGRFSFYIRVPRVNAYENIDSWWPEIENVCDNVDVILVSAGLASRALVKRLFLKGIPASVYDFGSINDAAENNDTRTWINWKGKEFRDNLLM